MAAKKSTSIAEYIEAAPAAGHPYLECTFEILQSIAPDAEQLIKWNTPFFIEPRFLFSFSATMAHLNFAPSEETMRVFEMELATHQTAQNFLQVPYKDPLPEELIRKIAHYQLKVVSEREDDSFW